MEIPREGDENELTKLKALKNRKEKERRARRKREQKTGSTSDNAVADPAEMGVQNRDQGVEERLDLVVQQHDIESGTASEGAQEATTLLPSVQAGEHPSISQAANEQNRPAQPPAEPYMLATQPIQDAQMTLPSPPPAINPQTTPPITTTSGARRTSRPLIAPAIPFNLQFSKKPSTTMQHENPDTQSSATEQESDSTVAQIAASTAELTISKAQATTEDTPETEVTDAGMESKNSPEGPPYETKSPISATHVAESSDSSAPVPAQAPAVITSHTTQSSEAAAPAPAQAPAETTPHTTQSSEATTPTPTPTQAPAETTSRTTQGSEASTPAPAQASAQQRLVKFDTYEWPCRNQECRKLTSPYDESTVICPRCGPYSLIRYCSKKCLFDDLLMHWGVECGSFTLAQKADPMTITRRQISIQPYIPSLDHIDRPERFRQFVRHSIDTTGDYFIFSDWADWRNAGFRMPWPAEQHASGSILAIVNFTQTGSSVPSRMLFTRLLRICFLVGGARTDMAYFLFKMIIGRLTELGLATSDIKNCLVWQFKHEFAYPGGFADLLMDQQVVNWPLVAGQVECLSVKVNPDFDFYDTNEEMYINARRAPVSQKSLRYSFCEITENMMADF
ncbi:hypothetical protein EPUS_03421 [Endocarpon pusillum Z07020]|uniref:Uncharacterized protein n=1 Tax=Endocarpon pusillum (strain Z07020 / HMAS-L-300199) TaxID=1263415 RepID=U1GQJ2_ENDPU|nr:uncharacterized protein EPUS_03421 [Endocarpon pusillum Z07020]ERF74231.1 hypothetical protein EPUS_03421 [Endocarpon pusillum Z07020]